MELGAQAFDARGEPGHGVDQGFAIGTRRIAQIALRLLAALVRDGRAPPKLTLSPITVISKDTIGTAVPWEATAASTDATLNMDLSKLQHDFAK